jgi:hypothetical protein
MSTASIMSKTSTVSTIRRAIRSSFIVSAALLTLCLSPAIAEDFSARLKTLEFHLDRLGAITVVESAAAEKAAKLDQLRAFLQQGAGTEQAYNDLYLKIDDVRTWLLANSAQKPARAEGAFEETPDAWIVRNPTLEYALAKSNLAATVRTPAETWRMSPANDRDVECAKPFSLLSAGVKRAEPFNTGYSNGMSLTLAEFPDKPGLELALTVNLIGNEIVFEIAAPADAQIAAVQWPKPIETANAPADIAVLPSMQGMLIPGDWPRDVHREEIANSRTLYMPWWGALRNGRGVLAILETPYDAGVRIAHNAGGPTRVEPLWYASLGKLAYLRTARYVFDDNATYVSLAKRYRRYVIETGRFIPLEQKLLRTPALNDVVGRPVVHQGALYHFVQEASLFNKKTIEANHNLTTFDTLADQLRALKAKGIESAYVHLDGWGFYGYDNGHPDVMPVGEEQGGWDGLRRYADTCAELGYLFAVHDQYRDFYLNAVSFDDRLAALRVDGTREQHATWCGGPQTILSPRFAPEYVRRNHDRFAENGVKVRGAYLDVFSVVPPEESAQRAQPVTRAECAQYRRQCFDLLRARGYVVSSEEPTDYLVGALDLVHHAPYWLTPGLDSGEAIGIPVPLFNLVYHDSILIPWGMGEDGGWGIPKGDSNRLHCLLNAGMPYVYPGADDKTIEQAKLACELNRKCATSEMVNHEFLNAPARNYRLQKTTFANGVTVTVDFESKECQIK